ncbi:hypothetical protein Tsubulata_047230 [Turnera subulata]|uniref:Barwin domain-containing protein n=1 Tax=Turnera subulata TaxID=218843 RepID=A0A9Q0JQ03_9ROSI|nr:hypothetical protein Tsubulata_047230 [Turnera subulata]
MPPKRQNHGKKTSSWRMQPREWLRLLQTRQVLHWFNNKNRCHHNITIKGNGRSVVAMVVDECDSTMGCDKDHDYQPPCDNNIVDASKAVWKALGVSSDSDDWGWLEVTWSPFN